MNASMEATLEKERVCTLVPKGTSMLPLIRPNTDTVVIEKKDEYPKKYDVVLYKRKNGVYVLHRAVEVKKDSYTMCGDNHKTYEYGVKREQLLGVMTALIKDGKEYDLCGKEYKKYVKRLVQAQHRSHLKEKLAKAKGLLFKK